MNIFERLGLIKGPDGTHGFTELNYRGRSIFDETQKVIDDALAHYCPICRIGFKGRNGKTNHMKARHKDKL